MSSKENLSKARKRKNVFLGACLNDKGEHFWKLKDLRDNTYDPNFDAYQKYLSEQGLSLRSRKRYSEVVAMHIDYLIERAVYGNVIQTDITCEDINEVIKDYIHLVEKGSKIKNPELKRIAQELFITRTSASSYASIQSALNHFYTCSARRARGARQRMKRLMPDLPNQDDYEEVIIGINLIPHFREEEKKVLRETSMLGGVIRWHGEISRPRSLPTPKKGRTAKRLVYPLRLRDIKPLIAAATCYRDQLFWLGLIVGGPRPSEWIQCRVDDVNVMTKEIFVPTAEEVKVSVPLEDEEKVRFKARESKELWLLPEPFKSELFRIFRLYMLHEYIPNQGHDFIFQYSKDEKSSTNDCSYKRGDAYYNVSSKSLNDSFKGAIKRAGILPPDKKPNHDWTLYSCRHFYADYLLNEIKGDNGNPIFSVRDVQMCMSHGSIESTEIYAKEKEESMRMKFLAVDALIHNADITMDNVAEYHAKMLRKQADKIDPNVVGKKSENQALEHKDLLLND